MRTLRFILLGLALGGVATGCDTGDTEVPGETDNPNVERRGIGKADHLSGSCEDSCGGQSGDGNCWCDDMCEHYGDCCNDKWATCDEVDCPQLTPPPPDFCGEGESIEAIVNEATGCTVGFECAETCPVGEVFCALYCEFGFATDENGCVTCSCNPDPLEPTDECFIGGCSGQLCTDQPGAVSTCEALPEYGCYQAHSQCERQPDGACSWTPTDALEQCIEDASQPVCQPVLCELFCANGFKTDDETGCAICACADDPPPVDLDSCADSCGGQAPSGACWCDSACSDYGDCCDDKADTCDTEPEPATACFVGGCSGQICSPFEGMVSTCEWVPDYACYQQHGTCEAQPTGGCSWTPTPALTECLDQN